MLHCMRNCKCCQLQVPVVGIYPYSSRGRGCRRRTNNRTSTAATTTAAATAGKRHRGLFRFPTRVLATHGPLLAVILRVCCNRIVVNSRKHQKQKQKREAYSSTPARGRAHVCTHSLTLTCTYQYLPTSTYLQERISAHRFTQ